MYPLLWKSLWISTVASRKYVSVIGLCRADWEVLEAVIGQVDEPFQVTLLYTSCLGEGGATVALDSLEFIDCESGKSIKLELLFMYFSSNQSLSQLCHLIIYF